MTYKMTYKITLVEWRNARGWVRDDGYNLYDYARAAGVPLEHTQKREAERAARKITKTPDKDGVYPRCEVMAIPEPPSEFLRGFCVWQQAGNANGTQVSMGLYDSSRAEFTTLGSIAIRWVMRQDGLSEARLEIRSLGWKLIPHFRDVLEALPRFASGKQQTPREITRMLAGFGITDITALSTPPHQRSRTRCTVVREL